jgi:hypothetical protein
MAGFMRNLVAAGGGNQVGEVRSASLANLVAAFARNQVR